MCIRDRPVTDPDFELLAVNKAEGFRAGAQFYTLPPLELGRDTGLSLIHILPFYMFGQAMNPIIRADGNPRFAMISTLAGAALNIILDPVFIDVYKRQV